MTWWRGSDGVGVDPAPFAADRGRVRHGRNADGFTTGSESAARSGGGPGPVVYAQLDEAAIKEKGRAALWDGFASVCPGEEHVVIEQPQPHQIQILNAGPGCVQVGWWAYPPPPDDGDAIPSNSMKRRKFLPPGQMLSIAASMVSVREKQMRASRGASGASRDHLQARFAAVGWTIQRRLPYGHWEFK